MSAKQRPNVLRWSVVSLAFVSVGALAHCASNDGEDASNNVSSQATSTSSAAHRRVSFLVASDLHFGYGVDNAADDDEDDADDDAELTADTSPKGAIYARNEALESAMEQTLDATGKAALAKHDIENDFRGVIVTGDIGDNGQPGQFSQFVDLYGIDGKEKGKFPRPVYETTGNHDYPWKPKNADYTEGSEVHDIDQVILRNRDRIVNGAPDDMKKIVSDPDSGSYAWKWDDVLFVNLGVKASDHASVIVNKVDGTLRDTNPFGSLAFLKKILRDKANKKTKQPGSGTPVVLAFHYPMVAGDDRMTHDERTKLHDAIADFNVVAIIHGHRHRSWHYKWCGIPVLEVDSPRNAATGFDATFLAVDIDDAHLNAQTVRYEKTAQGILEVRYEDTKSDPFNPRKKEAKNTFYRVDKMPLADIHFDETCNLEQEADF